MHPAFFRRAGFYGILSGLFLLTACQSPAISDEELEEYDSPAERYLFEIEKTKDPATGLVPWPQLLQAKLQTEDLKANRNVTEALFWSERGSDVDAVGPSNGNTRANGGITSGRVRAVMVDSLDPTKKTVWVGGVDGGLWKTTDITASPANWILINDFLNNLAVADICQDPRPGFQNIMYMCTGESYGNFDAVQGVGVFKSTDAGVTWNFLSSTSTYINGTRILCDHLGNVYLGTRGTGLLRSTDGGTTWTNITPSGIGTNIADLEISNTAGAGRLHVTTGIFSTAGYRYTDNPATVTAATWTAPVTPFTSFNQRIEIAVSGNNLIALPINTSYQVPTVWKTTDGGANWIATSGQPAANWASGQGWYSLSAAINPANPNEYIVGGLDCHKTTDGGATWTRISFWVGTTGQYVHADQHDLQWYDGGNKLVFACDGGIHYSANGGTTIRDRNVGLRLKQFYSVAIHPTSTNYFIGGTQDNGTHQFNNPGLSSSVEVTGGDGAFTAIDQDQPQFQFGAYIYSNYRRSTNGGASWGSVNFGNTGRFINPFDYDNSANILYAADANGVYRRWDNPQTGNTSSTVAISDFGSQVSAVFVSPFTANRVFFGTGGGRVVRVDNAHTAAPTSAIITPAGASGYVNAIVTGSTEQNMLVCYSNYGVNNVWVTSNGGTSWTAIDGNLPNMPVRWALFHPDTDTKAFIATETGVWETDLINGASTVWNPNSTFPNVRVDMIKYRPSDRTIIAATHGRGMWTATVAAPSGFTFDNPAPATAGCPAPNSMSVTLGTVANGGFANPITLSAIAGVPAGTTVSFGTNPVNPGSSSLVTLNNTNTLATGSYVITIQGTAAGSPTQTRDITFILNPGTPPVITTQPASQSVCPGANVSFTVASSTPGVGYQWQVSTNGGVSWSPVSGATSATYSVSGVAGSLNGNQYRCVVSTTCGVTNSQAATLTVGQAPVITTQPQAATVCAGTSQTFCVTATGTNLTYQWQAAPDCTGPWTNVAGGTSSCLTISNATSTLAYRCNVTSTDCGLSVLSACVLLTVVNPPALTGSPANQTVCAGGNASFSVSATGAGIIYQWQESTNGGASWNNISGANTASYTLSAVTPAQSGNRYRCQLSNATCTTPVNSASALLTVNTLPAIGSQPADLTLCVGATASFTVSASGTGIGYQWQLSTDGGTSWNNISGATAASYTTPGLVAGMNGYRYRCIVSGTCTPAAVSAAAVLTVISPPVITSQSVNVEVCSGNNASFGVNATSSQAIIYQWQLSTDGGATWTNINGANSANYTVVGASASQHNNRYRCLVSNATCTAPVAGNAAILQVRQTPSVGLTAAPLTTLLPGQTTTLTATPSGTTGGTFTSSWQFNTAPLTVSGNTYMVNVETIGSYQVRVQESWPGGLVCSAQSPVVTIGTTPSDNLFIFPSPNDGRFTVSYYNAGGNASRRTIVVFDSKGSQVYFARFAINGPYTLLPVDLRPAQKGIYYVVIGEESGKRLAEGKVLVGE